MNLRAQHLGRRAWLLACLLALCAYAADPGVPRDVYVGKGMFGDIIVYDDALGFRTLEFKRGIAQCRPSVALRLAIITDDERHFLHRGECFRFDLRGASGDNNLAVGILPLQPTDRLAGLANSRARSTRFRSPPERNFTGVRVRSGVKRKSRRYPTTWRAWSPICTVS